MNKIFLYNMIRFALLVILLNIYLYDYGLSILIIYEWMPVTEFVKLILLQLAIILLLIGKPRKPEIILLSVVFGVTFLWAFIVHMGSIDHVLNSDDNYIFRSEYWYETYYFHKFLGIITELLGLCFLIIFIGKLFISFIRYITFGIKYHKSLQQGNA